MYIDSDDERARGEFGSSWVLITRNPALLESAAIQQQDTEWDNPRETPIVWTDDFSSLWRVLR